MGKPNSIAWETCEGRNGWDHPLAVPEDMGTEAINVTLVGSQLGEKRAGSASVTLTGDSYSGVNYTANYWTQNQNPSTNNGPTGSGQPWTIIVSCAPAPDAGSQRKICGRCSGLVPYWFEVDTE